jgi:hypothetical protein
LKFAGAEKAEAYQNIAAVDFDAMRGGLAWPWTEDRSAKGNLLGYTIAPAFAAIPWVALRQGIF